MYKIDYSTLNATTLDIMNTIRANSSLAYFNTVPVVEQETDIPKVGQVILGTPAFANEFINALLNRIAFVQIKSSTFNNPYKDLKKGYLDYGETIEEVFVEIAKVRWFSRDKAPEREFKKTVPNVYSAFHTINWEVQYPVSIQYKDLQRAFLSPNGVTDMIAKIIDSLYRAGEYDEYLLFKYMLIKGINAGEIKPFITDSADLKKNAADFRGVSNSLLFLSDAHNARGVYNDTPRDRQVIFMDAAYNAKFDVEVLASAFNMDKAEFMGRLKLIDNFTTFDNERWAQLRGESNAVEEVTETELTNMEGVVAVIADEEWFQVYDNLLIMTEKEVASGLYWNYFLTSVKTVSWSPFSNAIVFKTSAGESNIDRFIVSSVSADENATVIILSQPDDVEDASFEFSQEETFPNGKITLKNSDGDDVDYPVSISKDGIIILPGIDKILTHGEALEADVSINLVVYANVEGELTNLGGTLTVYDSDNSSVVTVGTVVEVS